MAAACWCAARRDRAARFPSACRCAMDPNMARILLVEDDRAIVLGLRENLAFEGHTVLHVARGDEALDRLNGERPDLLILDVMLPGLNGFEVCRRVRQRDRRLPILML